jgi:hypothetical protein
LLEARRYIEFSNANTTAIDMNGAQPIHSHHAVSGNARTRVDSEYGYLRQRPYLPIKALVVRALRRKYPH